MLKKVISLFLVLCILLSLVGCGGGNPVVPPVYEESVEDEDIIFVQNTNPEDNVLAVAGKAEGEALAILGEKDASGNPIKITGAVYTSEQGEAFIIDAGDDGLPTYILDSTGNRVVFTNYTDSTVEISIYNSNNELIEGPTTIIVDPTDLAELKQLYSSVASKNKDAADVVAFVLKWGGFGLNWATCVVAAFSLVVPAIVFACGSAVLSTVAMFTPNDTDNLILSNIGVIQCAFAFKPWEIVACAGSIMSFIGTIIENINQDNDENENHPPVISDLSADPPSVNINQTTTITCFASDPDGDPLTYHWTKNVGSFEGSTSGSSVTWRAPSTQGNYTITCEVSDGEASDSEQVVINVNVDNDDPSTLPAPATVLASQGTFDMIQIAWSSVTGATHYRVYRATSETGTKTAIEGWGWITNNYAVDYIGITQGVHYFYFVKAATDSIGSNASNYSECAEGWTTGSYDVIPTIYDPGSSVNSGTPYTVSWSDESADGAEKYNLFEIESTATSGTLYTVYGTSKEFTHNVDKDTTYYYKVRAYSDGGWSSYSDQVDMVVKEAPCEIWTASQSGSGVGVTTDGWDISAVATGSEINFYFDAMGIPDRWFIYYNGVLVYQTGWRGDASYDGDPLYPGGVTSPGDGQVLAVITKLAGVNILEIRTEGKDSNTEWNYSLRSICK